MTEPDDTVPSGDVGERARDGLEHLQAAMRELIGAARAVLDVAEGLVDDPETVAGVVASLGSIVQAAGRAATNATTGPGSSTGDDPRVERIRVS